MITATSSPDRFGSLLRGLLKKNISNMVYLALIGFIGIPLPYLLAMFRRWEEKGQWVYENISTADRGGLYVGIAVGTVCLLWLAGSFILALSGVGYMHNRRAVDLYHSLPVTRGQLLLGHVLANFLTVALPMTANTLLTAALAGIRHGMTPDRAAFHLGGVALDLLGWYVTAFAIIVMVYLAATQVGSTFDTFLFSGVFLAALVAALRLDMLAEKAMDYYDQERRTVCYLYLESELDEKYSHQPAEKDFYSSFTVPVGESYTHTLELLREWGLEGYLIPAEWDSMFVTAWGCDVVGTGRVILPLWYGVETEIFSQAAYEAGILLSREEAEPLLALADWTYPNTGSDDCLYLSLVRTAADGTKTYGLPMFLPLEEARRQPLLREYMAEQYGEKLSTPETVDAETLEAR